MSPAGAGLSTLVGDVTPAVAYRDVPLLDPGVVGEIGAVGGRVLPELRPWSQSFIAVLAPAEPLLPAPWLMLPGPVLLMRPPPALGLSRAEPEEPQPSRELLPSGVPELPPGPDIVPLPVPTVTLVCAMAAPLRVMARTDAAVKRRRFIGSSMVGFREARPEAKAPRRCPANRGGRAHVPIYPLGGLHARPATTGPARGNCAKKKGRTEARPEFREEKPEGLAVRSGRSGLALQGRE
jgi:hypothetical protein